MTWYKYIIGKLGFYELGSDFFKHCSEEKYVVCYCSELYATFRINSYRSLKSKIHPRTNDALSWNCKKDWESKSDYPWKKKVVAKGTSRWRGVRIGY